MYSAFIDKTLYLNPLSEFFKVLMYYMEKKLRLAEIWDIIENETTARQQGQIIHFDSIITSGSPSYCVDEIISAMWEEGWVKINIAKTAVILNEKYGIFYQLELPYVKYVPSFGLVKSESLQISSRLKNRPRVELSYGDVIDIAQRWKNPAKNREKKSLSEDPKVCKVKYSVQVSVFHTTFSNPKQFYTEKKHLSQKPFSATSQKVSKINAQELP
ncbi:hypothetical protein RF11_02736 [Thelohanellus kitauei]|uniref:Uncharacterized protein n=1 Tax=Thelohanellus kitauei TaxID=669202 RepID=A0A0C2MDU0_THEKT|nr:hypothetical protein RF11_02736 [Thelohanellus kitauei]